MFYFDYIDDLINFSKKVQFSYHSGLYVNLYLRLSHVNYMWVSWVITDIDFVNMLLFDYNSQWYNVIGYCAFVEFYNYAQSKSNGAI